MIHARIIDDLIWAGIDPPKHGRKTTCPQCSPRRLKSDERCLGLFETGDGIRVECYHCGWEKEFIG